MNTERIGQFIRNNQKAVVIIGSALILTATILIVNAASPFSAFEAEGANLTGNAVVKSSSGASGGSYVEFTETVGQPPSSPCTGVNVPAGANLANVASSNPSGTTFCLAAGTYNVSSVIFPKSQQKFIGAVGPNGERLSILTGNNSATRALQGESSRVEVEIHNVIIEKFNNSTQQSPVSLSWPPSDQRWVFDNVEARYNKGVGLSSSSNAIIRNSYIHHNGQLGINGQGGGLIENNEISYNNYLGEHDWGWEGGGAKWVNNNGLIVRGNYSHHNCGPGLWTDGPGNSNILYENNRTEYNHGPGIMHEIGRSAIIRNNTTIGNAFGDASGLCRQPNISGGYIGGILISESRPVEVYGNKVIDNDGGIMAVDNDRGTGNYVADLWVHDNEITISKGSATGCADNGDAYDCFNNNNRWDRNTYHVNGVASPFQWLDGARSWSQWRSYGFDINGSFN